MKTNIMEEFMLLCDVNPFIRCILQISYKSVNNPVRVGDCRLFYILSGDGEIIIENQHYALRKDSLFYCRAGSEYNIISEGGLSIITFNFDLSQKFNEKAEIMIPQSPDKNIKIFSETVLDSNVLNSHIFLGDASQFYSQIRIAFYEFNSQRILFQEMSGAILKEILIRLHRIDASGTDTARDAVSEVIRYIDSNYQKEITNKELASMVGYHEYHLNRLFLKHTGRSMHNYILNIRISEAKRLILNTDLSCNVISENVGFKNYTYFSSYFKKEFGISPTHYRAKFKNRI